MKSFDTLKILVAEPDRQQYGVLQALFRGLHLPFVRLVEDSRIFLDTLEEEPFDIVMIDWALLPANALEMVRYLRLDENSPNRRVPIIVLFSTPDIKAVMAARDAGADEFLVRPFTQAAVRKRLREIIERPRPFVRSANYLGPDRRRKTLKAPGIKDRRALESDIVTL